VHVHIRSGRWNGLVVDLEVEVAVLIKPTELEAIVVAIAAELAAIINDLANKLGCVVVVPVVEVNVGTRRSSVRTRNLLGHEVDARDLANLESVLKELRQFVLVVELHIAVVQR